MLCRLIPENNQINVVKSLVCLDVGVGHRGYGAEAEEGADRSESLGPSSGGLAEPPVQRLLSDHQGMWRSVSSSRCS